jgi:hypothetical protein
MRPPGCAPNPIWADTDHRERLHARGASAESPRPVRQGGTEEPRNAKQITLPAQDSPPLALHVIDDLPDVVPVSAGELDVIETYLGAALNDLLGRPPE